MSPWACGIGTCEATFETPRPLVAHQATDHGSGVCRICGEPIPAGFLGIRHVFEQHTRAQYVRAYDASADDIRVREELLEIVGNAVDLDGLVDELRPSVDDATPDSGS